MELRRIKLILGLGLALALTTGAALAGWGDEQPAEAQPVPAVVEAAKTPAAEEPKPAIEDSPEWDKYAFNLPTVEGDDYMQFTELARSGRPFILVWWVSDCSVCHLQLPYVQQLERLAEKGQTDLWVVSINIDADDAPCLRYVNDKDLSFEVLRDPRARRTDSLYKVRDKGTPVTYVFKPGGEYVTNLSGFTKGYPKRVLELLGEPVPAELQSSTPKSSGNTTYRREDRDFGL